MTEDTKRTMEVCFFIFAAMMLIKSPAEIIAYAGATVPLLIPGAIVFTIACAVMLLVSTLRLINHGSFWLNLVGGIVYFMNIIMWIEVI